MSLKYIFNFWLMLAGAMLLFLKFSGVTAMANSTGLERSFSFTRPTDHLVSVDYRQLKCVATAIYYESAHEPEMGKVAVARVIQNRVRQRFASSPCEVIYQKHNGTCQFSWACSNHKSITATSCAECWRIATDVFAKNQHQSFMPSALFFHANYVEPGWHNLKPLKTIGHHKFYRKY